MILQFPFHFRKVYLKYSTEAVTNFIHNKTATKWVDILATSSRILLKSS